jgi:hypothetical protein
MATRWIDSLVWAFARETTRREALWQLGAATAVALTIGLAARSRRVPLRPASPTPLLERLVPSLRTAYVGPPPASLGTGTWQWLRSVYADGTTITAVRPADYTVAFHADGLLATRQDPNLGTGTYSLPAHTWQGPHLRLNLGFSTLMARPPDSQADTFARDLSSTVDYAVSGPELVLGLRSGGIMHFERQTIP